MNRPTNWPDYLFHLPTLVTLAIIGLVVLWNLYDVGFKIDRDYLRLLTNQGNLSIYWHNGCCDIDW